MYDDPPSSRSWLLTLCQGHGSLYNSCILPLASPVTALHASGPHAFTEESGTCAGELCFSGRGLKDPKDMTKPLLPEANLTGSWKARIVTKVP